MAGIALLALIALVAGQRLNTTSSPGPAQPAGAGDAGAFSPGGASARAPDISALTPRERADRLYDRAMRASSEGKIDSSRFFGRMAVDAYRSMEQEFPLQFTRENFSDPLFAKFVESRQFKAWLPE